MPPPLPQRNNALRTDTNENSGERVLEEAFLGGLRERVIADSGLEGGTASQTATEDVVVLVENCHDA